MPQSSSHTTLGLGACCCWCLAHFRDDEVTDRFLYNQGGSLLKLLALLWKCCGMKQGICSVVTPTLGFK